MKISEITPEIVKDYCGISDSDSDDLIKKVLMPSAKAYIIGYTGLTAEEINAHEDLSTAFLVLVNDMYTQRDYTLSFQKQINPAVSTILGLYSVNYL
ncbi:MAG: head-tail connector protein [Ruminococcus flavefaciens]|nr:head-tail connector protein [Ruminococcus flavefaciens]